MKTFQKKTVTHELGQGCKPIHLCLVSSFPPSIHSLSEYSYNIAKGLCKSSRISKITVLADVATGEVLADNKIEVIRCWKLNDIYTSLKIIRKIHETKPDIVYFNLILRHFSSNRFINFLGYLAPAVAKKVLGIPVVVTLHNLAAPEAFDISAIGYRYSIMTKLGIFLATKLILYADVVTLTHQYLVNLAKKKYNAKNVLYLSHGLFEEPVFDPKYGHKRLLIFGRMGPYKGLEIALKAFKMVVNKDRESKLIIAGVSHYQHPGFLESLLSKYKQIPNLEFTGYVPEREIQAVFASCTAVLLPYTMSVWSSGAFMLACTYGRPVLASDLPDFKELQKEGAGVILFPAGDSEELAKAMELVLNDKELQKNLGEANLQWAKKNQRIEHTVERLVEIFEQLTRRY
jgi:glycosyltransferase involved in cell wall biosynthesis